MPKLQSLHAQVCHKQLVASNNALEQRQENGGGTTSFSTGVYHKALLAPGLTEVESAAMEVLDDCLKSKLNGDSMAKAHFHESHEVSIDIGHNWRLCLQWGAYEMTDGDVPQRGYRFICRREDGSLQSRPVVIPSARQLHELLGLAAAEGWLIQCEGEHRDEESEAVSVPDQDSDYYSRQS